MPLIARSEPRDKPVPAPVFTTRLFSVLAPVAKRKAPVRLPVVLATRFDVALPVKVPAPVAATFAVGFKVSV